MSKKKHAPMPELAPPSEDTLILNPGAALGTMKMQAPVPQAAPSMEPTQVMDLGAGESTQLIAPGAMDVTLTGLEAPAEASSGATQQVSPERVRAVQAPLAIPLPEPFESPEDTPTRAKLWTAGALAAGLAIAGIWWWRQDAEPASTVAPPPKVAAGELAPPPVPASYQGVHERAKGGDIAAMRTLGAVYYYGLGTPSHPEEGLRWYRRAAEAGSGVAKDELRVLEADFSRQRPARP